MKKTILALALICADAHAMMMTDNENKFRKNIGDGAARLARIYAEAYSIDYDERIRIIMENTLLGRCSSQHDLELVTALLTIGIIGR